MSTVFFSSHGISYFCVKRIIMIEYGGMNSGTRAFTFAMMGNELVSVIYDSRWLLATILICVLADFRYGWGESCKRYNRAKAKGDKIVMAQYKWRTSRAIRRTINKLMDYIMWVSIGAFIGMALLKPIGVDYMMGGVVLSVVISFGCMG